MRTAITMGLLLLMAGGARASDEYVNPMFCYRIVQPPGVTRVVPRADGTGITMEWGAPCTGPACVSIGIAAGYPRNPGDLPHAHAYYRSQGWQQGAPVRRTIAGIPWVTYPMSRRGARLTVHEYSRGRGKATYVVLAQYPPDAAPRVRRQVAGLLGSWRWLSACL
ncbi:hypothetical protein [Luteibacter aegosomatissinici]|uniref:hypothetical protein n=1 Tax=Luteibacter aegosomatissinici TaxID=2911539 RepID=UPI001FF7A2D6|nr:hypothetical protein [Luteibacter aegosomatissinici]UPG96497.1 hypothetical protein L2Y97_10395 [Luteibacter aegosomatissinici]